MEHRLTRGTKVIPGTGTWIVGSCSCGGWETTAARSRAVREGFAKHVTDPHETRIENGPEGYGWRPVCSCGWAGPTRPTPLRGVAAGDAREHREDAR